MNSLQILKDLTMSLFAGRNSSYDRKAKYAAKKRDKFKCVICGSKERLEVHHFEDWSTNRFLRFDVSNLVTLCKKHHTEYHRSLGGFHVSCSKKSFMKWRRNRKK